MKFKKINKAFVGLCAVTLCVTFCAALLFGCLQEKQVGTGDEPTPPPLPDGGLNGAATNELQATATLEATGAGGNDDSPPPLPG